MIDFHTHILPNVDDGSTSVEESLELLAMLEKQNVKLVCLTPHFYANIESIESFVKRRNESFSNLNYSGSLELLLGSEVHYFRGISECDELDPLCLSGTNIILIELPFETRVNDNIINELISVSNKGYRVVLAHFERYGFSTKDLFRLKKSGILLQSNCEYIIGSFFDSSGMKQLKDGLIDFIGSDCHNTKDRIPNYSNTVLKIKDKLGEDFLNNFMDNCYKILKETRE